MAKPPTKAQLEARKRTWRHNSFLGHAALTIKNMQTIIDADTTTPEAKDKALAIKGQCEKLKMLLKQRVGPNK